MFCVLPPTPECQYCGFFGAAAFSVKREFSFVAFQCVNHYACHRTFSLVFAFAGESWLQVSCLLHPAAPRGMSGHTSPCSAKCRLNI